MVLRSELIDRMLSEPASTSSSSRELRMIANWTDMDRFEEDNLMEVDNKIHDIDNEIWAKLIVMEKGTRTAKAYIRSQSLIMDGSTHEFDGYRIGLRRFRNPYRDPATEMMILTMGKGLELSLDTFGNVHLTNNSEKKIIVSSQGVNYVIDKRKEKIFDLRRFKESLSGPLAADSYRLKRKAIMRIQFNTSTPPLETPLWICLIHVIAVEMMSMISANSLRSNPSTSSSISQPSMKAPSPPPSASTRWSRSKSVNREDHFYELCTRDLNRQDDSDNGSYVFSAVNETSSSSSCGSPALRDRSRSEQRAGRFLQNEKEGHSRSKGGVKKKLVREKSAGPALHPREDPIEPKNCGVSPIMDLKTLSHMRRPVYFNKALSNRGGIGHMVN
ncbi:unnamed protein product [Auanema sp. JU1783]|nr:unnamed protein product [Auanema sp. JU1783]